MGELVASMPHLVFRLAAGDLCPAAPGPMREEPSDQRALDNDEDNSADDAPPVPIPHRRLPEADHACGGQACFVDAPASELARVEYVVAGVLLGHRDVHGPLSAEDSDHDPGGPGPFRFEVVDVAAHQALADVGVGGAGMNAYATPILLGGPRFQMMGPLVYGQFAGLNNWPFGAALAFVLMTATLSLSAVSNVLVQRRYRR